MFDKIKFMALFTFPLSNDAEHTVNAARTLDYNLNHGDSLKEKTNKREICLQYAYAVLILHS